MTVTLTVPARGGGVSCLNVTLTVPARGGGVNCLNVTLTVPAGGGMLGEGGKRQSHKAVNHNLPVQRRDLKESQSGFEPGDHKASSALTTGPSSESPVEGSPITDWVVGGTGQTIQQRSFSSLLQFGPLKGSGA